MHVKRFVAPVAVGLVAVVAFGIWWFTTRHSASPDVVEGWASPNPAGTAIGLSASREDKAGPGYDIADVPWTGQDDSWHVGGGPSCIGTDPTKQVHVQLGVVYVDAGSDGPGGPRVVWLRCLG